MSGNFETPTDQEGWFRFAQVLADTGLATVDQTPTFLEDPKHGEAHAAEVIAMILLGAVRMGVFDWPQIVSDAVAVVEGVLDVSGLRDGMLVDEDGDPVDLVDDDRLVEAVTNRGCGSCRPWLRPYLSRVDDAHATHASGTLVA